MKTGNLGRRSLTLTPPDIGRAPADEIVDMVFDTMSKSLVSGDRIERRGFGSFTERHYKGYTSRNAKTAGKK